VVLYGTYSTLIYRIVSYRIVSYSGYRGFRKFTIATTVDPHVERGNNNVRLFYWQHNAQSILATSATQGGTIYRMVKLGYIIATRGAQRLIIALV